MKESWNCLKECKDLQKCRKHLLYMPWRKRQGEYRRNCPVCFTAGPVHCWVRGGVGPCLVFSNPDPHSEFMLSPVIKIDIIWISLVLASSRNLLFTSEFEVGLDLEPALFVFIGLSLTTQMCFLFSCKLNFSLHFLQNHLHHRFFGYLLVNDLSLYFQI